MPHTPHTHTEQQAEAEVKRLLHLYVLAWNDDGTNPDRFRVIAQRYCSQRQLLIDLVAAGLESGKVPF